MTLFLVVATIATASFAAAAAAVPAAIRAGRRWDVMDRPDPRKRHPVPLPRTGGFAIAAGLLAGFATASLSGILDEPAGQPAWTIAAGLTMVFAVGLRDDFRGCSVSVKLAVEGLAASLVAWGGMSAEPGPGPLTMGVVSDPGFFVPIGTVAWLVGITNAFNLLDGLDGLAGGIGAIVGISLAVLAIAQGQSASMAAGAAICGACLGFLTRNRHPACIFLGDGGALTVGFAIACLGWFSWLKSNTAVAMTVPLLALGVPAIDMLAVMTARFFGLRRASVRQRIERVFRADRGHLHHYLLDLVFSPWGVAWTLYLFIGGCCMLALGALVRNDLAWAGITIVVEVAVVVLIRRLGRHARGSRLPGVGGRDNAYGDGID